jgi:SAM-dependent methyltransferase
MPTPHTRNWPASGLESCPACPACGTAARSVWYTNLSDRLYGCAPGRWTLKRCAYCGSAYLDPRPTRDTIANAYRDYYTHAPVATPASQPMRRAAGLRRALRHGYLNRRLGLSLERPSPLGRVLVPLVPGLAARQRAWARLPRPHDRASVLDVGAGSGGAVAHFRRLGWDATGLDLDRAAVAAARASDLPVLEGEITMLPGIERFDAVTMSHSIEHLHDPAQALAAAFRLLKPGGLIELVTPNASSLGRRVYARDWLGLDPPRHLVVFTPQGLTLALAGAGFDRIRFHRSYRPSEWYFRASEALRRGKPWTEGAQPRPREKAVLLFSKCCSAALWRLGEELVVRAAKPASPPHAGERQATSGTARSTDPPSAQR